MEHPKSSLLSINPQSTTESSKNSKNENNPIFHRREERGRRKWRKRRRRRQWGWEDWHFHMVAFCKSMQKQTRLSIAIQGF
jgi:hypothetical protein